MEQREEKPSTFLDRYGGEPALSFHIKWACNQVTLVTDLYRNAQISQKKNFIICKISLRRCTSKSYSQAHFSHEVTYLLSSDDTTRSPVAFNFSLLGSVANLWGKLSCEQQKLCPHSLHMCWGSSSGPGVPRLQMRYVLCNKGSRWASPATPTVAVPSRKLYLKNVPLNKFHEGRLWILALFSR